ncbi:MAG: FAD-dependent oxidoreductase [Proteobacteria bacterium]|nr:FAD-dependent oxidoreductase [Pseudomonadota bacterium]
MSFEHFLNPKFGLTFDDLYEREGLLKLDQKFAEFSNGKNDLIQKARLLEDFLVELFGVKKENDLLKKQHEDLQKISVARREFVQREVAKKFKEAPTELDGSKLLQDLKISYQDLDDLEKQLATKILAAENLETLTDYTIWALYSSAGRKLHRRGALFILPQKTDPQNLIEKSSVTYGDTSFFKGGKRGFNLTDKGFELNRALAETHYCIFCHKQKKDSCRTGIYEKDSKEIKIDSLKVELHGCPLDEKISEMNLLKSEGFSLAALAVATIDNPMIAGTGHRICNDCMKSCIYQKQDPVDIPQIETRTLKDVLALPYGFEIYSLLTRWNPLAEKKLPEKNSGKKVLVCGLGPAGYTLAHYLLNDGHEVVAIDGLKIEPLPAEISGIDVLGNRTKFKPIKYLDEIYESLGTRLIQGFGGVAEYGITVRFDKNYLKIIRLLLERRKNFRMFGGIRFGSSITDKIAFETYGFDHVALCIGAGRPNVINLKNNFAKGIKSASDFLMSLQLTGAFKEELFTNLQIRMPIVVIGGGLTATDTACEAQAYYAIQVKKFSDKINKIGKEKIWPLLNEEEKEIAEEFLRDQALFEKEGGSNALEFETGDLNPPSSLRSSSPFFKGGFPSVKILYRKKIQESPAYRLNHQELVKAFEEGIEFVENVTPLEAELDKFGHVKNLKCADGKSFECKTILVAAGTTPNLSPALEDGLDLPLEGKYFKPSRSEISFFGDLHPQFEGNVVKAMASAKIGHKAITESLKTTTLRQPFDKLRTSAQRDYSEDFLVRIEKVEMLSEHVFELFVKAPLLANQTEVGHIFRLQNYHALAPKIGDQLMAMEGLPVTALSVDRENGIISGIVVDTGGSAHLIKNFKAGEPCVFMGPSGKPTEIPKNETVVFVGGGRGNQPLTALAEAFSANGCRVLFFAGYRKNSFLVREERMRKSCAELIISIEDEEVQNGRFQGSVVDSVRNYFAKSTTKIDRIFTIGSDSMMHEIAKLRHENSTLSQAPIAITSLNSPMQCMLKGVCSQCLQKRKSDAGEWEYFYSCAQQDQNMDRLDFAHLHNRCEQNSLSEKVSKMWIRFLEKSA